MDPRGYDRKMYELHAEICRTLANPKRLEILHLLRDGEKQTKELLAALKVNKANLSQHLSCLKQRRMIRQRRDGVALYYRLSDERLLKACDCIREVLFGQFAEDNRLMKQFKG